MRKIVIIVMSVLLAVAVSGCTSTAKEVKETGIYQSMFMEDATEYVEILVNGEAKRYVVRVGDKEYAAVPDFFQKGETVNFYYKMDKDIASHVITRFVGD